MYNYNVQNNIKPCRDLTDIYSSIPLDASFFTHLTFIYWINKAIALFDKLISDGQTFWHF